MLSTLMYIHTNHVEMNTSKPRNKSIMSMKYIYIARSEVSTHARAHTENMHTENYMHTEHRHMPEAAHGERYL